MNDRVDAAIALLLAALLLALAGWIYWPGQSGPTMLDDRSSLLSIEEVRQRPELAWDYVTGDRSGPLGRPVSMASFVLEKLLLDGGVATSKRVNILLHLFNGALVTWLFWLLFRHIAAPGYRWLALVLGAAWLLSPLFVSSVLYVVQRMAMLCTSFMLMTCISYVYWRLKLLRGVFSTASLLVAALSLLLAVFSKENAVVVLPVILLLEALWFQFEGPPGEKIRWLQRITLGLIAVGGLGAVIFLIADYDGLAAAFRRRYFTLDERLLTQSRILWDYVGQLFIPDVLRMGLYHDDIAVSTSLAQPPSTRYAVMAWLAVALMSVVLLWWRRGRYLVLGIGWYLVGHSIESTVLPLELYFEHRNYFPSVGLFLAVGALFAMLVQRWPETGKPLLAWLACCVLWLASLTSSQVQVWSSHPLLILSQLNGHPDSFRANADMAIQMANMGDFAAARRYSDRAYEVDVAGERSGDHDIRDIALGCIAGQPVAKERIDRLGTANPARPFSSVTTLLTLVRLLQDDACPGFDRFGFADRMVAIFLAEDSPATASKKIYSSLAVLENSLQRWDYASAYMDKFLQQSPANASALLMKLHFATALGKVGEVDALKTLLRHMDSQGQLTVSEQQTLSLYLEN